MNRRSFVQPPADVESCQAEAVHARNDCRWFNRIQLIGSSRSFGLPFGRRNRHTTSKHNNHPSISSIPVNENSGFRLWLERRPHGGDQFEPTSISRPGQNEFWFTRLTLKQFLPGLQLRVDQNSSHDRTKWLTRLRAGSSRLPSPAVPLHRFQRRDGKAGYRAFQGFPCRQAADCAHHRPCPPQGCHLSYPW